MTEREQFEEKFPVPESIIKWYESAGAYMKATVGIVVELPVSIAADVVTMGGAMTDKDKPYTATAVEKIVGNIQAATKEPTK